MALIKFERLTAPAGSITFTNNPSSKGYSIIEDYNQPTAHSMAGDLYVYNKSVNPEQQVKFSWAAMTYTEFESLMDFYKTVRKSRYSFTFTDHDSSTFTAKFASVISWNFIRSTLLEISFDIIILSAFGTAKTSPSSSPSKSPSKSPSISPSASPS